jgi:hypothetical protein
MNNRSGQKVDDHRILFPSRSWFFTAGETFRNIPQKLPAPMTRSPGMKGKELGGRLSGIVIYVPEPDLSSLALFSGTCWPRPIERPSETLQRRVRPAEDAN